MHSHRPAGPCLTASTKRARRGKEAHRAVVAVVVSSSYRWWCCFDDVVVQTRCGVLLEEIWRKGRADWLAWLVSYS